MKDYLKLKTIGLVWLVGLSITLAVHPWSEHRGLSVKDRLSNGAYPKSHWLVARVVRGNDLRECVRRVFDSLEPEKLAKIFGVESLDKLPSDADKIEEKLSNEIRGLLLNLFHVIAEVTGATVDERIVDHSIGVLTSVLQTFNAQYTEESARHNRLERLSLFKNQKRVKSNLENIKELLQAEKFKIWTVIALLHDIGIFEQIRIGRDNPTHGELGYQLLKRNYILDMLELTQEEKELILLTIRYHNLFGYLSSGQASFMKVAEYLEDKQIYKTIIADQATGRVNRAKISRLLRTIALSTIFDIAGYGKAGLLTNNKVEYHLGMAELIINILNNANWQIYNSEHKLNEQIVLNIKDKNQELLPVKVTTLLSGMDINQDHYIPDGAPDSNQYKNYWYWQRFQEQINNLLTEGLIDKSLWRDFINYFPVINLRFFNYIFSALAYADPGLNLIQYTNEEIKENLLRANQVEQSYQINQNVTKFILLLSRAVRLTNIKNVVIGGKDGKPLPISEHPALVRKYMVTLNESLSIAKNVKNFDDSFYYVDKSGKPIEIGPVFKIEQKQLTVCLQLRED